MSEAEAIAFVPIFNARQRDLEEHEFSTGAFLTLRCPEYVSRAIGKYSAAAWISQLELEYFKTARGWLWCRDVREVDGVWEPFEHPGSLFRRLRTILWCIDLAGGGENDYWRFVGHHCCGVYWDSSFFCHPQLLLPLRFPYTFPPPTQDQREAGWGSGVLQLADDLSHALASYHGRPIARLALANDLRRTMATMSAKHWRVRFQLAVTALETFYIAPSEHLYLSDSSVRSRVRSLCAGHMELSDDYFELLRKYRADMVHRGGQARDPRDTLRYVNIPAKTEEVLRATLRWGILHQEGLAGAFEDDRWPV